MSEYTLYMATALLITVSVFVLNPAQATSHSFGLGGVVGLEQQMGDSIKMKHFSHGLWFFEWR